MWAKVGAVGNATALSTASRPVRAAHRPQIHSLACCRTSQTRGRRQRTNWLDTDKHSRTARWRSCCRRKAPRPRRWPERCIGAHARALACAGAGQARGRARVDGRGPPGSGDCHGCPGRDRPQRVVPRARRVRAAVAAVARQRHAGAGAARGGPRQPVADPARPAAHQGARTRAAAQGAGPGRDGGAAGAVKKSTTSTTTAIAGRMKAGGTAAVEITDPLAVVVVQRQPADEEGAGLVRGQVHISRLAAVDDLPSSA